MQESSELKIWPNTNDVKAWVSDDLRVNAITDYDIHARAALIYGDLTVEEYLLTEEAKKLVIQALRLSDNFDNSAYRIFKNVISNATD